MVCLDVTSKKEFFCTARGKSITTAQGWEIRVEWFATVNPGSDQEISGKGDGGNVEGHGLHIDRWPRDQALG